MKKELPVLTELEQKFVASLSSQLYAESGFTDVEISEIADDMEIPVNTAKGVLGSLVKKGIVCTEEYKSHDFGSGKKKEMEFIIFHPDYFYLVPHWV